ncbi:choline transporter-like protein 1 isoform X1 [Photinus pyralis]|nr:choline transporter-like protein 1 isoform X1 [Photinus pyralis]XP_031349134.1 choline transporter-like protein 1 isoform X1 [Photinus pyralis]
MGTLISIGDKIEPKDVDTTNEAKEGADFGLNGKRHTTDILFLLVHGSILLFLIPLLLYCVYHGDVYRIINGYDSCLNVCGKDNVYPNGTETTCDGKNMSSRPYILVFRPDGKHSFRSLEQSGDNAGAVPSVLNTTIQRACLKNCSIYPHFRPLVGRCVLERGKFSTETFLGKTGLNDFFGEVSEDFERCWPEILYLCIISLAFSIVIMVLFRLLVGVVIWIVLVGIALASTLGTAYLWILWHQSRASSSTEEAIVGSIKVQKTDTYLTLAIIASILTLCLLLIILVLRKRLKLVIQLFKEAGKAIGSMPLLLVQPLWTFACIAATISCWLYFTLWIESAGHKKKVRDDFYIFEKDTTIVFTRWYNIFVTLWLIQFIIGCQHMVIAGAVSSWYFTRAKTRLNSPILFGLYNLLRYHLGSVSFGSFIIAVVQLARVILMTLNTYVRAHEGRCVSCITSCCQCCLYCLENILKFITRNAYIEITIHGYNFCRAGRRAFEVLASNALRVATINSVGDFVLFLGKVLIVVSVVLIGIELIQKKEGILHAWVPLTLSGLFAYFISHCFLSVYEMAIDTIFICFCEDCDANDGLSRPYYMSKDLMEFVESSNESVLKSKPEAWSTKASAVS